MFWNFQVVATRHCINTPLQHFKGQKGWTTSLPSKLRYNYYISDTKKSGKNVENRWLFEKSANLETIFQRHFPSHQTWLGWKNILNFCQWFGLPFSPFWFRKRLIFSLTNFSSSFYAGQWWLSRVWCGKSSNHWNNYNCEYWNWWTFSKTLEFEIKNHFYFFYFQDDSD